MYKEGKVVEFYANNMALYNESYKGKLVVSSRDFCFITKKVFEADGSIILPAVSVEDPRVPPTKGNVRARLITAGWIIRPLEGGKSSGTYIVTTNLAGSIPGFMQNMAAKGQTSVVKNFAKAYAKRYIK
eukprot:TRINITY_DN4528_c0_g1_i19.p1 TRINITY_DN4528_c0_g1~~TRINITY_DN4528_c0_g1_i19.p1  ORF type:complete len:129 (+),score=50.72 TRINITY_DN4528_c0_g1_i19:649-1035(+)